MSRFADDAYDGDGPVITPEMWAHNVRLALAGKRGQKALRDLRAALLALPEPRLISRALCTVGWRSRDAAYAAGMPEWYGQNHRDEAMEVVLSQGGEGVCAVGAYIWGQKVKAGADPEEAFADIPTLLDTDSAEWETVDAGSAAGLTRTLAYELAYRNDETWAALSPEERWTAFIAWIDKHLTPVPA